MSYTDKNAIAQRAPLSQYNIPFFAVGTTNRSILISSEEALDASSIPTSLRVTDTNNSAITTTATTTLVNPNTIKLTLGKDSKDWVGTKTFVAEEITTSSSIDAMSFRFTATQSQTYSALITTSTEKIKEGNSSQNNNIIAKVTLDKTALSDIDLEWSINGIGLYPVDSNDFEGNSLPSGKITIKAGTNSADVALKIKSDLIQENNEAFKLRLKSLSGEEVKIDATTGNNFTILNDDFSSLSGSIHYWKKDTPLNNVTLCLLKTILKRSRWNNSTDQQIEI